jgi:hypothetical protein
MHCLRLLASFSAMALGASALAVEPRQLINDAVIAGVTGYTTSGCGSEIGLSYPLDIAFENRGECVQFPGPVASILLREANLADPLCRLTAYTSATCDTVTVSSYSIEVEHLECEEAHPRAGNFRAVRAICET